MSMIFTAKNFETSVATQSPIIFFLNKTVLEKYRLSSGFPTRGKKKNFGLHGKQRKATFENPQRGNKSPK